MLKARRGGWWDANKIGLSPPLIETPRGWLMLYHGVRRTAAGALYRVGLALLDLEHPERCLQRGESWVFGPEAPYELQGDVANVVFPCGTTLGADGDTLHVYYGAADTSIGVATASLSHLLAWLDANGASEHAPKPTPSRPSETAQRRPRKRRTWVDTGVVAALACDLLSRRKTRGNC